MLVFLFIFSFGAFDFYSFLYQKCMTFISFSLNRTFVFKLCFEIVGAPFVFMK